MEARLLEGLSQLLNLTPEQQQRLGGVFENIETTTGVAISPAATARLRVHLRPSTALRAGAAARRVPGTAGQPFGPLLDRLSPRLRTKLLEIEPRLLAWIAAGEERGRAFAADPIDALQQAVPDLEPDLLAEIRGIRASQARLAGPLRGIEVTSVTVDTNPSRG
jgi:hypothetical protein